MKQIKYFLLSAIICIVSIALVFQSCNNSDLSTNESAKITQYDYLDVPNEYMQVGQFHNEGMDSIYQTLKNTIIKEPTKSNLTGISKVNIQKAPSLIDLESIIQKSSLNYCKSNNVFKSKYASSLKNLDIRSNMSKTKSYSRKSESDSTSLYNNLNDNQKKFMAKIQSIVNMHKLDNLSSLKRELNELNKDAKKELNKEDLPVIYVASSVAFSSAQYWHTNIAKWYVLLNAKKIIERCKSNPNKITRFKSKAYELGEVVVTADMPDWMRMELELSWTSAQQLLDAMAVAAFDNMPSWLQADINNFIQDNGSAVATDDFLGGAEGFLRGAITYGTEGLVFGPDGVVIGALGGGVTQGVVDALRASGCTFLFSNFRLY